MTEKRLKKVKILKPVPGYAYFEGEKPNLPEVIANEWIEAEYAEEVEEGPVTAAGDLGNGPEPTSDPVTGGEEAEKKPAAKKKPGAKKK